MQNIITQIQELENLFDQLHSECSEMFGDNHDVTIMALKGSARSFGLYCDFLRMQDSGKDE